MIVYFLAVVWIGAIAAPIDIDLELDDVVRALRTLNATTLVSPLVDEDDAEDDVLYQRMKKAAETLDIVEWHVTRTINEGVVLETHGRRAAEGAAWSGGASDFRTEVTQVAVHFVRVVEDDCVVLPLTHQNFAAAICMFSQSYQLDATNVTLLTGSWSTVDGLNAMLATIYSGGHVLIPGTEPEPDANLLKLCSEHKVDWFSASPQFLSTLASIRTVDSITMSSLKFKFIRSLSGNLDTTVVDSLKKTFNSPVIQGYGSAETCGVATLNGNEKFREGTKGLAMANCIVKIFDEETRLPVGVGVRGMVGVSGLNVATGYLNNSDINKRLVVQEKDASGTDILFFLTGDEGFLDSDGYLHVDTKDEGSVHEKTFSWERALIIERRKQAAMEKIRLEKEEAERERAAAEEKAKQEREEAERLERIAAEEKAKKEKEEAERQERLAAEEKVKQEKEVAERQERAKEEEKAKHAEQEQLENASIRNQKSTAEDVAKGLQNDECKDVEQEKNAWLEGKEQTNAVDSIAEKNKASDNVQNEMNSSDPSGSNVNRNKLNSTDEESSDRKVRFNEISARPNPKSTSKYLEKNEKHKLKRDMKTKQGSVEDDEAVLRASQKPNRRSIAAKYTDNNCKGAHAMMGRFSVGSHRKDCDDEHLPIQVRLNNIVAAQRRLMRRKSKWDVDQ